MAGTILGPAIPESEGVVMATFIDGPAAGVVLNLRRLPIMLRVVESRTRCFHNGVFVNPEQAKGCSRCNGTGSIVNFDALNEPDDESRDNERIHVYRMIGDATRMHVKCARPSISGYRSIAKYEYLAEQPAEMLIRSNQG